MSVAVDLVTSASNGRAYWKSLKARGLARNGFHPCEDLPEKAVLWPILCFGQDKSNLDPHAAIDVEQASFNGFELQDDEALRATYPVLDTLIGLPIVRGSPEVTLRLRDAFTLLQ